MVQIKTSIAFVLVAAAIAPALAQPLATVINTPKDSVKDSGKSKAISAVTTTGDAKPVGAAKPEHPFRESIKPHGSQQPHKERSGSEGKRRDGEHGEHRDEHRDGGRQHGEHGDGRPHGGRGRERDERTHRDGPRRVHTKQQRTTDTQSHKERSEVERGRRTNERQSSVDKQQPTTDTQATPVASREYVYELDARQDGGLHHHHHHHHGMHRQGNPTGGGPTDTPPTDAVTPSRREYTDEFFERSFDDFDLDARDFEFDLD